MKTNLIKLMVSFGILSYSLIIAACGSGNIASANGIEITAPLATTTSDDAEYAPYYTIKFISGTGPEADCMIDTSTYLMWPKDGALFVNAATMQQALGWINDMNSMSYSRAYNLCGHTDWRLPNKNELEILSNYRLYQWETDPIHDLEAVGFTQIINGTYWTNSEYIQPGDYTIIHMGSGNILSSATYPYNYLWPVRSIDH